MGNAVRALTPDQRRRRWAACCCCCRHPCCRPPCCPSCYHLLPRTSKLSRSLYPASRVIFGCTFHSSQSHTGDNAISSIQQCYSRSSHFDCIQRDIHQTRQSHYTTTRCLSVSTAPPWSSYKFHILERKRRRGCTRSTGEF